MKERHFRNEKRVAEVTGLALQTLRNQRSQHKGISYYKIGRAVRYCMEDVYRFMDRKKITTEDL